MSDYKMEIQERAEILAEEVYGKDFYDLTGDQQYEIFTKAAEGWQGDQYDRAEMMRDDK